MYWYIIIRANALISTRQEHNGHSHQNPSFIGAVLNLKAEAARVYLPPDANCFMSTMAHCLRSRVRPLPFAASGRR
jgi:phosphoketolase